MLRHTLSLFDPNITQNSPAGSCLLKMLRAAGTIYDLDIFTVRTDVEASAGVTIRKLPVPRKPVFLESILFSVTSVLWQRRYSDRSLKISTQGGFPFCDISYAHCCHRLFLTRYRMNIAGGLLTRTARLVNHQWSAWMESIAFRHAKVIVAPSQGLANELTSAYGEWIAAKLQIIANPVDYRSFACRTAGKDREFTFAFCALGNFEWKGLALILSALANGVPGCLKVIGGTRGEIERYQKLAQSLNVLGRVSFLGFQRDIRSHLWESDVFILPSVYETFPLVCLQAAAAGLPLIAGNLYGLERILQPELSGWRVERSVESVSKAMMSAVSDKARTADMGRKAQELAEEYDTSHFQKRWLELLEVQFEG